MADIFSLVGRVSWNTHKQKQRSTEYPMQQRKQQIVWKTLEIRRKVQAEQQRNPETECQVHLKK